MTLAKRVIPTILCRGKTAFKGQRYNSSRSVGSALAIARVHAARGVDELMILDISATAENRGPDLDMVRELSAGCFIPITVGGGVRSLKDIDALLRAGADKVSICDAALAYNSLIQDAAARFGSQAIVVCIDAIGRNVVKKREQEWPLVLGNTLSYAKWLQMCGAGEILLSSVDRDGMMQGYDLDLIREVSQAVSIPVIASGGCGTYEHMLEAFKAGADACASGAMFAFTDNTPRGAAQYLKTQGLEVRL
jgi:cyclase